MKVLEAYTRDVGRGIVRIDYDSMDLLDATTGNVIEIRGKRRTVARCLPLYTSDGVRGIIRADGIVRNNAGTAIGDTVDVKKVKVLQASKILASPLGPAPPIDERYLVDALEGVPIIMGDKVMVPYFGGRIIFQINGITPNVTSDSAAIVTPKTICTIVEAEVESQGITPVSYEDIGGLKEEIQKVREMIELPMRHPEIFEKLGIEAPKGVLLYGPPGTGKTLLAKAASSESDANFLSIKGPELFSKWIGESERGVREIFRRARQASPCIIFFDELDAVAPVRGTRESSGGTSGRMVSQIQTEMDGISELGGVVVLAATNRPESIEPALLRPGRFDKMIPVPSPDEKTRKKILQIHSKGKPLAHNVDLGRIAEMTDGFSGADLAAIANTAASIVFHRYLAKYPSSEEATKHASEAEISASDFEDAVEKIRSQREMKREKLSVSHFM